MCLVVTNFCISYFLPPLTDYKEEILTNCVRNVALNETFYAAHNKKSYAFFQIYSGILVDTGISLTSHFSYYFGIIIYIIYFFIYFFIFFLRTDS